MKIKINQSVWSKIPGVQVGVVVLKNINNSRKYTTVDQLMRGVSAQKKNELKSESRIKELNLMFQKARSEKLVLQSAQLLESNVNKIARGKEFKSLNNLYTLIHYIGIKYLIPIFAVDLDQIGEDIEINFIESKQGKRPDDLSITPETKHIVFWFINLGGYTHEDFEKLPTEFVNLISKYCGGTEADIHFLEANAPEIDLNYESDLEKENKAKKEAELVEKMAKEALKNAQKQDESTETDQDLPNFLKTEENNKFEDKVLSQKEQVKQSIFLAVNEFIKTFENINQPILIDEIDVNVPTDFLKGRYSTNIAMKLAKTLQIPSTEISEKLSGLIKPPNFIKKVESAGAGFINFYYSFDSLKEEINKIIVQKNNYGRSLAGKQQRVLIEYSSPNIAKPLGVHHLLSTIIGQTLYNLFKYSGYNATSLNWPGDWGTQFGKLIYAYKKWGNEEIVKKDPLGELLKLYVRFHEEEEKKPKLTNKGREEFKKLEEGDEENNNLWEWIKDLSMKELEKIYSELGVNFDEYLGERMYLESAKEVIEEGLSLGFVEKGEKGALIVKFDDEKLPPYMLKKADGTTLYASRDLASLKDRIIRMKGEKIVYVIDVAQKLHMQQLFETAKKYNWGKAELKHVIFGRMQLPDGKMSTRKGDVILLEEVIKEAKFRTLKIVEEKSSYLSIEEKNHIAVKMAIGAIKYNIISQNPETNITFEWDKMLSMEGNSSPYLQYTCARAKSILRKAKEEKTVYEEDEINENQINLFFLTEEKEKQTEGLNSSTELVENSEHEANSVSKIEEEVMLFLTHFPEVVIEATNAYKPNLLTNYLFDLARKFNNFYNEIPVLNIQNESKKEERLKIVNAVVVVLENGLKLLGIEVFERM